MTYRELRKIQVYLLTILIGFSHFTITISESWSRRDSQYASAEEERGQTIPDQSHHCVWLVSHEIRLSLFYFNLEKVFKKIRDFSLTRGEGSPQFPTFFIYDFVKQNYAF